MKKLYILMIAMFLVIGAKAQWVQQYSGTTNNLNSVFFTDANTGFVVGDGGIILKTIDGGSNWQMKSSGTSSNLYSVQFTDLLTGYAVGDSSIILKTIDGGENWIDQPTGISVDLSSVSFPATDTGYVVGFFWDYPNSDTLYNYILKTNNGGNLWTISYLHKTIDDVGSPRVWSVFFPDVITGYAVGTEGVDYRPYLLKTTNGGMEWTGQTLNGGGSLSSAYFLNPDTGYVVGGGEPGSFKTINGGIDWINLTTNALGSWYSVYFNDANKGYIVGENNYQSGIILYTADGGINWTAQYTDNISGRYLLSVNFANDTTGYAVGSDGTVLKTTNGGYVGITDHRQDTDNLSIYPNPTSNTITIETQVKGSVSILNLNGQQLLQQEITEQCKTIAVSGLKSGVYFVRLTNDKTVQVGKFVKQ
jgi:photosystem II stability/assembly factor-like uncharacterized protein